MICLWGDHGFHLGEQGLWTKANNYEWSTRVPLVIVEPGQESGTTDALVELVDVYPTLVELCELPVEEGLEGRSLAPLIEDPGLQWADSAMSQYPRAKAGTRHKRHGEVMGYTIRTRDHRYVEWREWESGKVVAVELYDHARDPDESTNVAQDSEYNSIREQHEVLLRDRMAGSRSSTAKISIPNSTLVLQ